MKLVHINKNLKPDPVKELVKVLDEKWDARDEAQAEKDIPKLLAKLKETITR